MKKLHVRDTNLGDFRAIMFGEGPPLVGAPKDIGAAEKEGADFLRKHPSGRAEIVQVTGQYQAAVEIVEVHSLA